MPDENDQPTINMTNWSYTIQPPDQPKVLIEVDDWGIKIMNRETSVTYLEMSYTDITDFSSRLDSAEAEIGKLIDIINGMREVGY